MDLLKCTVVVSILVLTNLCILNGDHFSDQGIKSGRRQIKGKTMMDPIHKFTHLGTARTTRRLRKMKTRMLQEEQCDYGAVYCSKTYSTSKVCGRTLFYHYYTFENYCMMEYVNCVENYEVWQLVHMGDCFTIERMEYYLHDEFQNDTFLDQIYVEDDAELDY